MTYILFGNLMPEQIEKRLGIKLSDEHIKAMKETHQQNVDTPLEKGKWHCFDLPFRIMCSDQQTAQRFIDILKSYDEKKFKEPISIGYER